MQPPSYPEPYPGLVSGPAQSAQEWVHVGRLLTLVLLLVELVVGIVALAVSLLFGLFYGVFFVVGALIGFFIYAKLGEVEAQIGAGQYGAAKDGLILWGILAVIFVWVLPGIFLLLAYLKLDEAMRPAAPAYGYPLPGYAGTAPTGTPPSAPGTVPAPGPAPPPPPPPPAVPLCPTCGQPATFIPQYGRYYCYRCQRYL